MDLLLKLHMMWGGMVILFILSIVLRGQKITPMLLRFSYLVMLGTGIGMLFHLKFPLMYVVKGILAILLIGVMEMILGKAQRGERTLPLWILFAILIVLVPAIGYGFIRF
jgi:hypothetical protein